MAEIPIIKKKVSFDFALSAENIAALDESKTIEIAKTIFDHNFQHFRSLNNIMWSIPPLAGTATGGIFYFLLTNPQLPYFIKAAILLLSAAVNCSLGLVIRRLRDIIQAYIENLNRLFPLSVPATKRTPGKGILGDYGVVKLFQGMVFSLAFSAVVYASYIIFEHFRLLDRNLNSVIFL